MTKTGSGAGAGAGPDAGSVAVVVTAVVVTNVKRSAKPNLSIVSGDASVSTFGHFSTASSMILGSVKRTVKSVVSQTVSKRPAIVSRMPSVQKHPSSIRVLARTASTAA